METTINGITYKGTPTEMREFSQTTPVNSTLIPTLYSPPVKEKTKIPHWKKVTGFKKKFDRTEEEYLKLRWRSKHTHPNIKAKKRAKNNRRVAKELHRSYNSCKSWFNRHILPQLRVSVAQSSNGRTSYIRAKPKVSEITRLKRIKRVRQANALASKISKTENIPYFDALRQAWKLIRT